MSDILDKAKDFFEDLGKKAEPAFEQFKDKAGDVFGDVKDKAEELAEKAAPAFEQFKDKAGDILDDVKEKAEAVADGAKDAFDTLTGVEPSLKIHNELNTELGKKVEEARKVIADNAAGMQSMLEDMLRKASGEEEPSDEPKPEDEPKA